MDPKYIGLEGLGMDPVIVLLMIIMIVLTVLLVIVGVQVILILTELRLTLKHVNHTLKNTDDVVAVFNNSFTNISHSLSGFKSGLQLMDVFFNWIKDREPHDSKRLSSD
jgi:hypothetical protein